MSISVEPAVIFNSPGLTSIAYRPGGFTSFRNALLQPLPGETELSQTVNGIVQQVWTPGADGDLAMQMIDWWSYLLEVLSFYTERIANQAYLGTADQPANVERLIQILGYRPRPAIGATGVLAAVSSATQPFTLKQGFQVQSKPGPGQQPQVFELSQDTQVNPSGSIVTLPVPSAAGQPSPATQGGTPPLTSPPQSSPPQSSPPQSSPPLAFPPGAVPPIVAGATGTVLIKGVVGNLKVADEVLLVAKQWDGTQGDYAVGKVTSVGPLPDPAGNTNTEVTFQITVSGIDVASAEPAGYRLLKSRSSSPLYPYLTPPQSAIQQQPNLGGAEVWQIDLASVTRGILVGDPILIEDPGPNPPAPPVAGCVTSYTEVIFFANNPTNPGSPPPATGGATTPPAAIPIPHSRLQFATPSSEFAPPPSPLISPVMIGSNASILTVRYNWQDLGTLIDMPAQTTSGLVSPNGTLSLQPVDASATAPAAGTPVLVADANGNGLAATTAASSPSAITVSGVGNPAGQTLASPVTVLSNLLPVSRGKSVTNEVLGSGTANVAAQDFTLQNAPVTYLRDAASRSGVGYSSTVQVQVNAVPWQEVKNFFGQPPGAQVFVTYEDDQGDTHIAFGDGINGARLPTGVNNVVANYRFGAGADVPASGTLKVVLQPQPNLKSIVNPVPPAGGADADPPAAIRRRAPLSVASFGRAVSTSDYTALALGALGVTAANTAYAFDATSGKPCVTVWVAGDDGAVTQAQSALAAAADPGKHILVTRATAIVCTLNLTYVRDGSKADAIVQAGLHSALLDPDTGLFGSKVIAIGQALFDSQIAAACVAVPGVAAIHALRFDTGSGDVQAPVTRLIAPASPFSAVKTTSLPFRDPRHDPGNGGYFSIPDDGQHLIMTAAAQS